MNKRSLPDPHEATFSVLVSIPSTYPATSAPQLQLLSRYIGPFGVDSALFGAVLRTFISSEGIEWVPDSVCVFDGLENAKERCTEWFEHKKSEKLAGELLREDERGAPAGLDGALEVGKDKKKVVELDEHADTPSVPTSVGVPDGVEIIVAEPITDRKSSFVGRACRITDPAQVCPGRTLAYHSSQLYFTGSLDFVTSYVGQASRAGSTSHHQCLEMSSR